MRVGVISDVHGNLPAFEAILSAMPEVHALVCAGDVVGYNPWPAECLERVRELEIPTVQGNHDRAVAGGGGFGFNSMAGAGVEYARGELDEEAISWLGSLPAMRSEFDGRIHIAHGHPDNPDRYTYPEEFSARLLEGGEGGNVETQDPDVLVLGHTHVQGHRVFEEGVVMNPGSVGQPRDGDPRAAYALLELGDPEDPVDTGTSGDVPTVEEHRVEYDIETVVEAVEEAGLPKRIGTRLREGR
ncbi:Serine/threonine protein phosphatase PP2A family [Halalkaliarchaeum sp. AArc-CO]|uniref:metallophosphoesterase family protein n=1 Tax=Halalkaliarchaeum sp. AArc-CO TaxID=2866381 RepID=UPI00217EB178|nr:metallophosphoesterase family protein [Halalkaliarchaeum sp. AArc-CO]UWG52115.1 Serine/threonine protein phosphatase PP2A family [Halalkaliarchaeum sp. AArc-CO]